MDLESQSAHICAVANLASHNGDFPKMSFQLYVAWENNYYFGDTNFEHLW